MIAVLAATAAALALRIVSLAPNLTEDLFAIGAGPTIVGVDAYSNRPPAALRIPRVGSLRTVNSEAIAALNPNLVVGIAYQLPNLRDLDRMGLRTQAFAADSLADDFAAIATLGRLSGRVHDAHLVLARIQRRLAGAARRTRLLPALRALAVIGVNPNYTAGRGSFIADLFVIAHLRNVADDVRAAYPALSAETIAAADPDVLVVPSGIQIPSEPPWSQLRAVREHRLITVAEDDLLRPGPRVADVVEALVRGAARYRGSAGATAKARTEPSGSRRTAIGMR